MDAFAQKYEKCFETSTGSIHYWVYFAEEENVLQTPWLVFLPGLTADHRLFEQQITHFKNKYNCFVWDAPAHGKSRPTMLEFSLKDLAENLHSILQLEQVNQPVLVGQSMGGYVAQVYIDMHPDEAAGFISIDSAPLAREYYADWELFCVKHTRGMYRSIPWNMLVKWSSVGNAETPYGQTLMHDMMLQYTPQEFCNLAGYGFRSIAEAIERHTKNVITCPVLLLCGEHDKAGFVKRYNKMWTKHSGYPLVWIPNAGHNANTDNPGAVNAQIAHFLDFISEAK